MLKILSFRIKDNTTFNLLKEIINSFTAVPKQKIGMPIGNLTSQIFANIYLNELDRFIKHGLKIKTYVRYGDDFVVIGSILEELILVRTKVVDFLKNELKLDINPKSDKIIKSTYGLKYLGVKIWPYGRKLSKRNISRIETRLKINNIASYSGLIKKHGNKKSIKKFDWLVYDFIFPLF